MTLFFSSHGLPGFRTGGLYFAYDQKLCQFYKLIMESNGSGELFVQTHNLLCVLLGQFPLSIVIKGGHFSLALAGA